LTITKKKKKKDIPEKFLGLWGPESRGLTTFETIRFFPYSYRNDFDAKKIPFDRV